MQWVATLRSLQKRLPRLQFRVKPLIRRFARGLVRFSLLCYKYDLMDTLNLGLIGAGLIGSAHSFYLTSILREQVFPLRLRIVGDPDQARLERLTKAFQGETLTTAPMKAIEDPEGNAVFICTPIAFHKQYVEAAAAAGKAVFCEKPLALDAAEAQSMDFRIPIALGF